MLFDFFKLIKPVDAVKILNTNIIQCITKIISKKSLKIPKGNQNRKSKDRQHNDQKKKDKLKDKHWSTKHTDKTKDRVTRTPKWNTAELYTVTLCV
jgi:ribosome-binding ATPase YchF (GTP1/OBG family)